MDIITEHINGERWLLGMQLCAEEHGSKHILAVRAREVALVTTGPAWIDGEGVEQAGTLIYLANGSYFRLCESYAGVLRALGCGRKDI